MRSCGQVSSALDLTGVDNLNKRQGDLAANQAVEPVSALYIYCRFGGNDTCGAGIHGIIMFFMDLEVLAKFSTHVLVVIDFGAGH